MSGKSSQWSSALFQLSEQPCRLTPAEFAFVISINLMTSSIPSGFSPEDLENLLANAISEDEQHSSSDEISSDRNVMSEDRIIKLACKICDDANELASGPLLHKVVALTILSRLVSWHNAIAESRIEDGETEAGHAWSRDAGKLQAAALLLQGVCLGSEDFTSHEDN